MPEQATLTMDAVTRVTVVFALALALSFVVERILEILKAAFDMYDSRKDLWKFWTRRADKLKVYIERHLRLFEYVDRGVAAATLRRFDVMLLGAREGHSGTIPILCGDLVRVASIRFWLKFVGIVIGIALALLFRIDLLAIGRAAPGATVADTLPSPEGMILTGSVIGLGTGVVHK